VGSVKVGIAENEANKENDLKRLGEAVADDEPLFPLFLRVAKNAVEVEQPLLLESLDGRIRAEHVGGGGAHEKGGGRDALEGLAVA
jgi:hypothetical protein